MRKIQRVAIIVAAVGCLSSLGAGVSIADGTGAGPQVTAWSVTQSAAGASAQGAPQAQAPQAAPQAQAPQAAPQPAPQAQAPQAAPMPAPQAAPQPAPQAQAPQPAPQAQAPQAAPQPAPQAQAPQAAPQPAPQAQAPQAAPQPAPKAQAPAPQAAPQPQSDGPRKIGVAQNTQCKSHDLNINILGQVGLLNGALGNALNGEGSPGAQRSHQGSRMGCDNTALSK